GLAGGRLCRSDSVRISSYSVLFSNRRLMACAISLAWLWPRALLCLQRHPGHHVENHRVFDVGREGLLDAAADGPRNHILVYAISVAGIERGKVFLHVWRKSQLSPG